MKSRRLVLSLLAAPILLVGSSALAVTPAVYVIDQFDAPGSVDSWFTWWGDTPVTYAYDVANAGGGAAGSGSMKVTADFSANTTGFAIARMFSGIVWWDAGVTVSPTDYQYFSMDIRWDSSSVLDANGTLPACFINGFAPGFSSNWATETMLTPAPGNFDWTHTVIPASNLTSEADLAGVVLRMWSSNDSGPFGIHIPVTFWIDNLELTNVPEPSSGALLVGGMLALMRRRRSGFRS